MQKSRQISTKEIILFKIFGRLGAAAALFP